MVFNINCFASSYSIRLLGQQNSTGRISSDYLSTLRDLVYDPSSMYYYATLGYGDNVIVLRLSKSKGEGRQLFVPKYLRIRSIIFRYHGMPSLYAVNAATRESCLLSLKDSGFVMVAKEHSLNSLDEMVDKKVRAETLSKCLKLSWFPTSPLGIDVGSPTSALQFLITNTPTLDRNRLFWSKGKTLGIFLLYGLDDASLAENNGGNYRPILLSKICPYLQQIDDYHSCASIAIAESQVGITYRTNSGNATSLVIEKSKKSWHYRVMPNTVFARVL